MRTAPSAINGTAQKTYYFPENDERVVINWEPGVGYLAHLDGDEERGTGVGPTHLSAIADLNETLGREE